MAIVTSAVVGTAAALTSAGMSFAQANKQKTAMRNAEADGVWSTFFPVAKKGTVKLRGCIDLRTINPFLRYEHFKMEGTHTLASMLRRRGWMTKIDLSDFYIHLPIAEADRKYFRFM